MIHLNQIVIGDARDLANAIPDESIDLIFTDPVYQNIEDYEWLAVIASRILKPNKSCLIWCSNIGQYDVHSVMSRYLRFVLPLSYTKVAKAFRLHAYKTFLWTTPLLWFHKGDKFTNEWLIDTLIDHSNAIVSTKTPPKDSYKWHKNPEAYRFWLTRFAKPGDTVYDPFTGSGSLPVECKIAGINFIASEIDPIVARESQQRLEQTQSMDQSLLRETQNVMSLSGEIYE